MKLRYVGPFDEVEVPELRTTVVHNGTVEAVGEIAERLLAQKDNFKRVAASRTPAKKAASPEPKQED